MANILFLQAHPDDEAIFTGGTIAALSDLGHEITVVFATKGELGEAPEGQDVAKVRQAEAIYACSILGAKHVDFLGYSDSGIDSFAFPDNALALADTALAAQRLAEILAKRKIDTLFCDDEFGVYGHPDHKKCHEIGFEAARLHGLDCVMESTIDGEHQHFVETHLLDDAKKHFAIEPGADLFRPTSTHQHPGLTTVDITSVVHINGAHLKAKREAMAAHTSQIPPDDTSLQFDEKTFREVYGLEFFRHVPISEGHKASDSLLDGLE